MAHKAFPRDPIKVHEPRRCGYRYDTFRTEDYDTVQYDTMIVSMKPLNNNYSTYWPDWFVLLSTVRTYSSILRLVQMNYRTVRTVAL